MHIVLSLAAGAVFTYSLFLWVELPTVKQSWSTQECVEVISNDPQYNCNNLPEKYEHVWVK